jgi:hypothetical protein
MHEVVHVVASAVRGRVLPREAAAAEHAGDERDLPLRVSVEIPLVEDAAHLGSIADAAQVHLSVRDALGESPEDRARSEDR